jgi:DNA-binding MarR family transcriptional regulator
VASKADLTLIAQEIERDLRAIRACIRRPLEAAIARGNLTGPQRSALEALVSSNGLSLKELSNRLGLAHSTVSGIVDRLEERGLVERTVDESDKRTTCILASKLVRNFVENELARLSLHPLLSALDRAEPSDRQRIIKGLKALRRLLEDI